MAESKKITVSIKPETHAIMRELLSEQSDSYSGAQLLEELVNLYRNTVTHETRLFSEPEVVHIVSAVNSWAMDFRQFSARQMFLHELEDYFRLEAGEEFPPTFRLTIETLSDFQAYSILRLVRSLWDTDSENVLEKAKFFLKAD